MTIHADHPFADPDPDPVRRFRGRLGGAVSLWTAGAGEDRAGLTVSSLMVAAGEPARLLGLLDPDSDLREVLESSGRGVVHLLRWQHRELAEAFAGLFPAPGGLFRAGEWEQTPYGPRLRTASTWAYVELEELRPVGWSHLATCGIVEVVVDESGPETEDALEHRRGRYRRT